MPGFALITGASDRIGKSFAISLAHLGYDILLHYNSSEKKAKDTQEQIRNIGRECLIKQANFKDEKEVTDLISGFQQEKPIEILINNASDFIKSDIHTEGYELLDHHFDINFKAPYLLTKSFAKKYDKGLIINILDGDVGKNKTEYLDYLMSKKALEALTYMSAVQLAPHIRVNGIAPGIILPPKGESEAYIKELAQNIPLQEVGSLQNLTDALHFLIQNQFITGQVIFVDGGGRLV